VNVDHVDQRNADSGSRVSRFGGALGILAVVSATPVALLAAAALTGVGLTRQLPGETAVMAGLLLTLLPALGLVSLLRGGPSLLAAAIWVWSLAVLLCLPVYFPEKRVDATARGLHLIAAPMGARSAERLSRLGAGLVGLLGSEPERLPEAIQMSDEECPDTREDTAGATLARAETGATRAERVVVLSYQGDGTSMLVPVFFDGPVYGEEFALLFDTGATYTTLNREALAAIGVEVPPDAPTVTLHTAGGEASSQLVLVDAVWLGEEMLEWVTVAVCEPCAGRGVAGLLGLNVTGQFEVGLHNDRKQIELRRLPGRESRKLDIGQWLELESRVRHWRDGRVQIELKGTNRAAAGIARALVELGCPGGRFSIELEDIPARGAGTTRLSLPYDTDCSDYQIDLLGGSWGAAEF
jgi:predicted aspartyl protease